MNGLECFFYFIRSTDPVSLHAFEQQRNPLYFTSLCPRASQCCPVNQRAADTHG